MKVLRGAAFLAVVVIAVVAVPGSTPAHENDEAVRSLTRAVEALKEARFLEALAFGAMPTRTGVYAIS